MTKKDSYYLQSVISTFKECIIHNIYGTGLLSQRFQITFDEIKKATERVRLSPAIVEEYIDFLQSQGITAFSDNVFSVMCEVDLTTTYLTPIEAQQVASYVSQHNQKIAYEE